MSLVLWGKMLTTTIYQSYNKDEFLEKFSKTKVYQTLVKDYSYLFSDFNDINFKMEEPPHRDNLERSSIFLYSMFFYLNFLLEINPKLIADIGCGNNKLKKYVPQIIGYDTTLEADIKELFNLEFIEKNYQKFDCAFAINSVHFISLIDFSNRVNDFGKLIKPGGRGFLAFNLQRMIERTKPHEFAKLFDLSKPVSYYEYRNYIINELQDKIKYNIIINDILFDHRENYNNCKGSDWPTYDSWIAKNFIDVPTEIINEINSCDFTTDPNLDDYYNGNIRIVFEV